MRLKKALFFLASLLVLAGCTSSPEKQAPDAISQFYGGSVTYAKGSHLSTNATEPQGNYLQIILQRNGLAKSYDNLALPASNCAYLAYSHLPPADRQAYNYFKVSLKDSLATHDYTFPVPELQAATQAAAHLPGVMADLQQRNYPALARALNPAAVGHLRPDSLTQLVAGIGQRVGPFTKFVFQGYDLMSAPVAGQPQQFVRLFVGTAQAGPGRNVLLVINPRLPADAQFLYGLNVLK